MRKMMRGDRRINHNSDTRGSRCQDKASGRREPPGNSNLPHRPPLCGAHSVQGTPGRLPPPARQAGCWALIAVLACTWLGCTAFPGTVPDVRPQRLKRVKEAAKSFDERRDEVEFQAATACWRHDDAEGCRHLLDRLLKRNADHVPARLLLTETYLVDDQLEQARQTFEPAQEAHGEDPRVLHMAGMLAEAAGDSRQALTYYQRAAKLAPGDEMYRLSYESAKEDLAETEPAQLAKKGAAAKRPKVHTTASKNRRSAKPDTLARKQAGEPAKGGRVGAKTNRSPNGKSPSNVQLAAEASEVDEASESPIDSPPPTAATTELPPRSGARKKGEDKKGAEKKIVADKRSTSGFDQPILRSQGPGRQLDFTDDGPDPKSAEAGQRAAGKPASPAADETRLADLPEEAKDFLAKGDAALAADAVDSARRFFRQARQVARQEPRVAISAAVLAIRHDELELAEEVAGDGLKAFPRSAGLYRVLGTVRYRLGDYPAARQSLEEAIALDKTQALSYFLMGSTLLKLGQPEAAERHFQQARRLDPRYARPVTG